MSNYQNRWSKRKAAAAAKSLQSCPTLGDPIDGSPPSLGFSRQEHWSGLPFPSPMHESEKWKWSHSDREVTSRSRGLQPTRLLHPWHFAGKSTGVGCHCLLRPSFLSHGKLAVGYPSLIVPQRLQLGLILFVLPSYTTHLLDLLSRANSAIYEISLYQHECWLLPLNVRVLYQGLLCRSHLGLTMFWV